MGPWVPRYVTTGCLVLFATGFALATPATASRVVRKKVIDTMVVSSWEDWGTSPENLLELVL